MINRKLIADYPSHPLVEDVTQKADMFDQYASTYVVPVHAKTVSVWNPLDIWFLLSYRLHDIHVF